MRLTLNEKDNTRLPENRVFNAEITSIKRVEKDFVDNMTGEYAVRIVFEFTILDDEFAGRKVWEDLFTSFYPAEKCKLYRWVLRILNRTELPDGFELDTDALEGTTVPIVLENYTFTYKHGEKKGQQGEGQNVHILTPDEAASLAATQPSTEGSTAPSNGDSTVQGIQPLDSDVEPF